MESERKPECTELAPGLRRLIAPNPSPMTYWGTNTYLIGTRGIAVVDPGPLSEPHLAAIMSALTPGQQITHILCTHSHMDHSPLAEPLAAATGAKVHAFGTHEDGRRPVMQAVAASGLIGGGEGVQADFTPDIRLPDGALIKGDGWQIEALHTPGHIANHLCFAIGDALLSGDHVMGWASSMVSPPDGDLTAFLASCERLLARPEATYFPAHGDPIVDPKARLDWLINHRSARTEQIRTALASGPATIATLTERIYTDTPKALLRAAERNVLATLIALTEKGETTAKPALSATATFQLA